MRTIPAAILSGLSAETVRTIYLVRVEFDSGTFGWNTGFRNIIFEGVTYIGLGEITSISNPKEEPGVTASGMTIGLSGIKPEIVSLLLSEPYINRPVFIHYTLLDEQDRQLSGNPVLLFRGSVDSISGELGESAGFSMEVKSRLADWERPRKCRYTDAEQQKLYPGDKGFEYVGQMEQKKLIWPRAAFLADPRD